MQELKKDLFSDSTISLMDAICATTNGVVKTNGRNVMGVGCALTARNKFPDIDLKLGKLIKKNGNIVQIIISNPKPIVAFPTKTVYWEKSSIELIKSSIQQLLFLTNLMGWERVILPRPGCSNGGLDWLSQIKPLIEQILDERFYVTSL